MSERAARLHRFTTPSRVEVATFKLRHYPRFMIVPSTRESEPCGRGRTARSLFPADEVDRHRPVIGRASPVFRLEVT